MRVALGCMRLSTDRAREREGDEARAIATVEAALEEGITRFDTARAYGLDENDEGHNERLLARALGARRAGVHIVTKCGMSREGGGWIADGRASRVLADAEASAEALGGPPELLLLHAPDPRVALATSVRALQKAKEAGLARAIGVSNVTRKQLEDALSVAPVAAVEVALGAYDDLPIRGGVVGLCLERGIEILAHAPLGGPKRVEKLARDAVVGKLAAQRPEIGAAGIALAYLLAVRPEIIPVVGARSPQTVARIAAAARLALDDAELAALDERFPVLGALRKPPARASGAASAEVILMMGVPGAGKSRVAEALAAEGYERLNRDSLGGTLRGIAKRLDEGLAAGGTRFVLDNTYVTRATRNDVLRIAERHGAGVRCLYFDTPVADAQINAVLRMIDRFGHVLSPREIAQAAKRDAAALAPSAIFRMTRELEPPAVDEGFASIEVRSFVREPRAGATKPAIAINASVAGSRVEALVASAPPEAAVLLFAWIPGAEDSVVARAQDDARALATTTGRTIESAICVHPAGPPICWCRPPLPGLFLSFAHRHGVDPRSTTMIASSTADRAMARALGMTFREP